MTTESEAVTSTDAEDVRVGNADELETLGQHEDSLTGAVDRHEQEFTPTVKVLGGELTKRDEDAGYDLRVRTPDGKAVGISPGQRRFLLTDIKLELPFGYAAFVLPRSGLARDHGITLVNSPGLIDSGYRGLIGVTLLHAGSAAQGDRPFLVRDQDRVAQIVIVKISDLPVIPVEELAESDRGADGFGSSGVA